MEEEERGSEAVSGFAQLKRFQLQFLPDSFLQYLVLSQTRVTPSDQSHIIDFEILVSVVCYCMHSCVQPPFLVSGLYRAPFMFLVNEKCRVSGKIEFYDPKKHVTANIPFFFLRHHYRAKT